MPDTASMSLGGAVLEVVSPDGARRYVRVTQTPFLIGRGAETGNHLQLSDRRISRNCAALVIEAGRLYIEDRGQRRGELPRLGLHRRRRLGKLLGHSTARRLHRGPTI